MCLTMNNNRAITLNDKQMTMTDSVIKQSATALSFNVIQCH